MKRYQFPLNINQKLLLLLVLMPFQMLLGQYISNALVKMIIILIPSLQNATIVTVLINYVFDIVLDALCIIVFFNIIKAQIKYFKRYDTLDVFLMCFLGVFALLFLNIIGSYMSQLLIGSSTSSNQAALNTLFTNHKLSMTILCVVIGPLGEELYYRVGWYGLVAEFSKPLAYLVSGSLFGLSHVISYVIAGNYAEIYQACPYILVGLGLTYIYDKYDSFVANYSVHALFNLLVCLIVSLAR